MPRRLSTLGSYVTVFLPSPETRVRDPCSRRVQFRDFFLRAPVVSFPRYIGAPSLLSRPRVAYFFLHPVSIYQRLRLPHDGFHFF